MLPDPSGWCTSHGVVAWSGPEVVPGIVAVRDVAVRHMTLSLRDLTPASLLQLHAKVEELMAIKILHVTLMGYLVS